MNLFALKDQVAVITGGGSGLGLAMAQCMAEAGATVVITGRHEDKLKKAIEEIEGDAHYVVHDVTDFAQAPMVMQKAAELADVPTILVNNAGQHLKKPALETTDDEIESLMHTHVQGGLALVRAAAPGMADRGHGSILFISSMAALMGLPEVVAYSAAKSALTGIIHTLAVELSPLGVRVNGIAPGWIRTKMMRSALDNDPERRNQVLSRTPMRNFGHPRDIGRAAVYLSSPAAQFVTGVLLPVDGGVSIGF